MQKVEDYRNHTEECRTMARRARLPGEREMLLNMAHTWDTSRRTGRSKLHDRSASRPYPEGMIKRHRRLSQLIV
jgi:hypothetical protein